MLSFRFVIFMLSLCLLAESSGESVSEVNLGNYRVKGCGDRSTSILQLLHILIEEAVQPAIDDALLSPTTPAYNTFFKDIFYAEQVLEVLTGIADGRTRSILDANPFDPGNYMDNFRAPMIICADEPKQYVSSKLNCPSPGNQV